MTADDAVLLVCGWASRPHFPEAIHGTCADCGVAIVWMPHAPAGRRICLRCADVRVQAEGEVEVQVTAESMADLRRWAAIRDEREA